MRKNCIGLCPANKQRLQNCFAAPDIGAVQRVSGISVTRSRIVLTPSWLLTLPAFSCHQARLPRLASLSKPSRAKHKVAVQTGFRCCVSGLGTSRFSHGWRRLIRIGPMTANWWPTNIRRPMFGYLPTIPITRMCARTIWITTPKSLVSIGLWETSSMN